MPQPDTCNKQPFTSYSAVMAEIKRQTRRREARHRGRHSERRIRLNPYKCEICQGNVFHMASKPKNKAGKCKIR